ncbi:MAG: four helix bundle protein [Thiobacillaceae bacterium]
MKVNSYRDLTVWQHAMGLAETIYRVTAAFPNRETYALASQLQRAAVSIPSNLAEGHARISTRDYLRFVSIAVGSPAEVETQLELSARVNYITRAQLDQLTIASDELGRMLQGLKTSLQNKLAALAPSP